MRHIIEATNTPQDYMTVEGNETELPMEDPTGRPVPGGKGRKLNAINLDPGIFVSHEKLEQERSEDDPAKIDRDKDTLIKRELDTGTSIYKKDTGTELASAGGYISKEVLGGRALSPMEEAMAGGTVHNPVARLDVRVNARVKNGDDYENHLKGRFDSPKDNEGGGLRPVRELTPDEAFQVSLDTIGKMRSELHSRKAQYEAAPAERAMEAEANVGGFIKL
jgi:hypothetical protein